ncbi:hypothetical protein INT48_000347 [Thamnidium elegans]|uniref:DDE Tnp4 domain-containing protein n=1 Tax=Thamnidium elegans TaxID=101142 RepID=A0A8H7VVP0_9FUNG|nr:hypothetical protein INT48_000347 [Thamnidium elegans]
MSTYNEESLMEEFIVLYEQAILIMNSSSSDLESLIIEQEMESNLLQEAFLFHHSADNQSFSNYHYWTITHPFLSDDDNSRTNFRAMYRMNRSSFERLVNDLSLHSAFDLRAHNSTSAYIQISCAIWRLANCHIGYRTSNISFSVFHGSYMNFFRRTLIAIEGVYGNKISWPVNQGGVEAIQTGFEWPHGQREGAVRRLPNIIGALDNSAYPLSHHVIVPYPSTETTGNSPNAIAKRKFNKFHSSARMSIERAFGLLSARWRFIKVISNGGEDENEGTIRESARTRGDELNRWFNPL